ncbi:hypothetical protein [Paenibacillus polymyxa]|uniref:hypothetical protein n=1 Tax=Paenibacillus polymyxa TaxID=1406 RepID=UPI0003D38663|nr:hypothetical protein [Paenibacillus polymyxa]AHC22684.1 hypothetical protein X809_06280 [Paenibacillus polymyxa CR1]
MKYFHMGIHLSGGDVINIWKADEELMNKISDFAVMGSDDESSPDWLVFNHNKAEYNLNRKLICAVKSWEVEV